MKKDLATEFKLSELILLKLEGTIQPSQMAKLNRWLHEDPEAVEFYVEYMMQYSGLTQPGDISISDLPLQTVSPILETSLWLALSEFEQEAEAVEIEKPRPTSEVSERRPIEAQPVRITGVGKFSLAALLLSSAALILLIVYAMGPAGRGAEVATVADTLNARWNNSVRIIRSGVRLSTIDDSLWLREGVATVLFDSGSYVVLEGPAEFEILTADQSTELRSSVRFCAQQPLVLQSVPPSPRSSIGHRLGVKADRMGRNTRDPGQNDVDFRAETPKSV